MCPVPHRRAARSVEAARGWRPRSGATRLGCAAIQPRSSLDRGRCLRDTSTRRPLFAHCDSAMNLPPWLAGRSGRPAGCCSRVAPADLCLNRLSDVERLAGLLASATSANAPGGATRRMWKPAAATTQRGGHFSAAPTFGRTCTENPRTGSESPDAALDADPDARPCRGATITSVAGTRTPMCVGMRVLRGVMARIAPRAWPAVRDRDVIAQRPSGDRERVVRPTPEEAPDDHVSRRPDAHRLVHRIGACASERCGPAIAEGRPR
jgi:hypothetical protein